MKCNYKRRANFSLSGHVMRQLVGVVGLQTHHVVGCDVERTANWLALSGMSSRSTLWYYSVGQSKMTIFLKKLNIIVFIQKAQKRGFKKITLKNIVQTQI